MSQDNDTWIEHLSAGGLQQHEALEKLRDALVRRLHRAFASNRIVDESFVEDVAQTSLLTILQRIAQFKGQSQFLTWATSIAIRIGMSELRRRHWKDVPINEVQSQFLASSPAYDGDSTSNPDRNAIVSKLHQIIRHELTRKQRAVLLGELRGIPQGEIARHLGSNRNAIYKLGHDARKKVRRCLEAAGFDVQAYSAAFAE